MSLTGPSSHTIAAIAAIAAKTPRASRTQGFSSSLHAWSRTESRGERATMAKTSARNVQPPVFHATSARVASRRPAGARAKYATIMTAAPI